MGTLAMNEPAGKVGLAASAKDARERIATTEFMLNDEQRLNGEQVRNLREKLVAFYAPERDLDPQDGDESGKTYE
jgi:hypothetical protein